MKALVKRPELFAEPEKGHPPHPWVRGLLILTCTGVSFAHGSNDGQKGMGLILLILIGVVPTAFALDLGLNAKDYQAIVAQNATAGDALHKLAGTDPVSSQDATDTINAYLKNTGKVTPQTFPALDEKNAEIATILKGKKSLADVPKDQRTGLRSDIYLVSTAIGKLSKAHAIKDADAAKALGLYKKALDKATNFIPIWVKFAVAIALGLGTMIGWKRIVVTVGERIGKTHLTYGQGASAEIVAYGTIQAADIFGLPVSTTHILSSGVAGTMAANHSGLQGDTLRNILLAWVLTLPVCVFLGSLLFAFGLRIVAALGMH
jgi:PiT family inorganic phosphate transporter